MVRMHVWFLAVWSLLGLLDCVNGNRLVHTGPFGIRDPDLILPDDNSVEDGISCQLQQTMAWRECESKVVCDSTCKTEADCTFPYCNSVGLCECSQAFCKTDRMCYFFRIECHGNFTCRNRHCYCD